MALFDIFKRDKGKEIFEAEADAQRRAEAIRQEIRRLGLPGNINVEVEGSRVKVTGDVPDEATRQKLNMIVGNIKYIEAVDDSALRSPQPQAARPKVHEVQSGDTLSSIADKYYGEANAYQRIFEANRPMLSDPDEIYPGQVLIIPEKTGVMA
ncbi:MAG: peptidoglycan-binding protein LysM [Pseudomonadota bacterium]|nr:peptidoglycan-binding protein LysM [Pseudomonadota bacterium]